MSIKWKMLALYLLLACVPLATGFYFYGQYKELVRDRAMDRLDAVASNLKARMALVHRLNSERLAGVASRTQLRISFERFQKDELDEDRQRIKRIMQDALTSIPGFRQIALTSPDGECTVSTDDFVPSELKKLVKEAGNHSLQSVTSLLNRDGEWELVMVGPLRLSDGEGGLIGYAVLTIDADDILEIARSDAYFAKSGEVRLVTHVGDEVHFLDTKNIPFKTTSSPVVAAINGEERTFADLLDIRGIPVLAATRYSEHFDLGLILKVNQSEIFGPVIALQNEQTWLTILLLIPVLLGGLFIARSVYEPVAKLKSIADRVSGGDWSIRANSSTRDEIGDLSRSFDHMLSELDELNKKQKIANEDLSHFAQVAAHDLREPARKGVALSEVLLDALENKDYEELAQLTRYIGSGSERMLGIVEDFRTLANIGSDDFIREPTDVKGIIEKTLKLSESDLNERSVKVFFDDFPDSVPVYPSLLELLYVNLIRNALEHVRVNEFTLRFTCELQDGKYEFGVENSGSQISEESLTTVFKMFRSDKKTTASGIGLSICKKVIDRHRGRIWVESGDNKTHFKFTLS